MSSERCPHCRMTVGVTPTRHGGLRCKLCRGPRVVLQDRHLVLSGRELPALVEARRKSQKAWLWWGTTIVLAMIGAVSLLLVTTAVLLADLSSTTDLLLMLMGSIPVLAALLTWRRGIHARRQARAAVHRAELSAAHDALGASERELTARELATLLGLPVPATEQLLVELNVDDTVMSQVTDAGEVTYRLAPMRMRIDDAPDEEPSARAEALKSESSPSATPSSPSRGRGLGP